MTAPYYQDDQVTLYHGDALWDVREWLEADVLVFDPPYGVDYHSNRPRTSLARSIRGDKDTIVRDTILSDWGDRPALAFGTWRIPRPERTRQVLVWDTKGALGMGAMDLPWKPSHQEIYVLGRGFTGRRDSDVITAAPVQSLGYNGRLHPHQKPETLMKQLIDKCPPGVITDPTCGSGTTLVAAKALGRKAIGVEEDEQYLETIATRLAQDALDFGDAS